MELSTLDRLSKDNEKQKRRRQLGLAFVTLMLLIFVGDRVLNGKRGESYHQQLVSEFSAIRPLPNALVLDTQDNFSPWNSHKALVGAKCRTSTPYSDIREFYNTKLQSHGWRFVGEQPLKDWGKDVGGREVTYCKGPLAASVRYGGEKIALQVDLCIGPDLGTASLQLFFRPLAGLLSQHRDYTH